jgi:hypothetical protein
MGNTNSPGVPSESVTFMSFQQRFQPKAGLVFRGIPGVIPSVDYSGSKQLDNVTFFDGPRFNNANSLNYSLNLTPGSWFAFAQKLNLTLGAGRTESASSSVPNYTHARALSDREIWLINPPFDIALNATRSINHQLNGGFRLFDFWDFKMTGTWTDQLSLLSQGTHPIPQNGRTLGFGSSFNHKLVSVPLISFNLNSIQLQYTRTDNVQYDSASPPGIDTLTNSNVYSITFPYDIDQKAQGNFHFQRTQGYLNSRGTETNQLDDVWSVEYDQKFLQNQYLHIPFTNWKIKFDQALEFRATFLAELIKNDSKYVLNQVRTQRYRGSIDLNYNALKNLRVGIGVANEYFTNELNPYLGYTLLQANISAEARF